MKAPRLSNMVLEQIGPRIETAVRGQSLADPWAMTIARAAQLDRAEIDEEAIADGLDAWLGRVDGDALREALSLMQDAPERTCDPRAMAAMASMGTNPCAMLLLSLATDGMVAADYGSFEDGQMCLLPQGGHDELLIPLTPDVYWSGERILLRKGAVPETLMSVLPGRSASTILDHPLLADDVIEKVEGEQGAFDVLHLRAGPRVAWTVVVERKPS